MDEKIISFSQNSKFIFCSTLLLFTNRNTLFTTYNYIMSYVCRVYIVDGMEGANFTFFHGNQVQIQ